MNEVTVPAPRDECLRPRVQVYLDLTQPQQPPDDNPSFTREWVLNDGAILHSSAGVIVALDETAHHIWQLHQQGLECDEVIRRVAAERQIRFEDAAVACHQVLDRLVGGCTPNLSR